MKILLQLIIFCLLVNTAHSQQKNIDEVVKQINFKLQVVNSIEGRWKVEANDEGDVLIKQTLSSGMELREGFRVDEIRMEVKPIENSSLFALYFRCKREGCVRFENDNNLVRMDNFATLFTQKKSEAERLLQLFTKLKSYTKKT